MVVAKIMAPSELFVVEAVRDTTLKSGNCLRSDGETFAEVLKNKIRLGRMTQPFLWQNGHKKRPGALRWVF